MKEAQTCKLKNTIFNITDTWFLHKIAHPQKVDFFFIFLELLSLPYHRLSYKTYIYLLSRVCFYKKKGKNFVPIVFPQLYSNIHKKTAKGKISQHCLSM